ncbi:hypothetical protein [Catellatospora chokoriensis]|uniref:Uncharacterized protein n=1 Tax=Catellatospora chokoriensis TaxID=310353 RepID=A0A8J3NU26_9ACTN|nr:hypothetical protein [Catellatospora chokoriensis]GIF92321.1 hypothetical protein Cch02nite_57650 [Catellatospora chokoriensis]
MAALLRGLLTTDTTSPAGAAPAGEPHRRHSHPAAAPPPSTRPRWAWATLLAAVGVLGAALATASGELLALGLLAAAAAARMLDRGVGGSFTRTGGPERPPARTVPERPTGPGTRTAATTRQETTV